VKSYKLFAAEDRPLELQVRRALRGLPELTGAPVRIARGWGLRDRYGDSHAVTFVRARRIVFDCAASEFPRIFVREVFHFVWLRIGNAARKSFGDLLAAEIKNSARGELGWSAELRKLRLTAEDRANRTRRWRDYCCESFCDSGAWLFSGTASHEEYTLAASCRKLRRQWFVRALGNRQMPI